ncbi:AraC family transcriptional regulator [Paenibacillus macerans]|uniref:AraC family transcriptional regulator n=1 Tax=Paenibacillus macerans TaxID=44252 RepID=UPI00203D4AD6|nr:AraC family transcriptional regulator [Paenibacillus macerans]MCM3702244.1 AraC family transcriptional regulator [Paenibacillus macerans]
MPKIEIPHRKSDRFRFKKTPELLFAGQVVDERRFYAPPQIHDFCEIIYIVEGAGEFRIAGKTYEVHPGDVAVYNAGVPHEERSLSPEPFKLIYCSPVNYLITRRIEAAKRLLSDSNAPVHEIASRVGYGNDKYFSMLFKKVTGQSPSAYRDSEKQKRDECSEC